MQRRILKAKTIWYGDRGEPIQYGHHKLRYIPGSRPVRLKYKDSPDLTVRNDVHQLCFFLENVKPGDFVLDIGGHHGQYAVLFASLVAETGRVITFEPDPIAREVLEQNLALNAFACSVEIETVALFDQTGQHAFFSKGADSMSSLARSGLGANASSPDVAEYVVPTARLDDYLTARALGFPQFVKLDTEGAEINILRGAPELLKSETTIVCELHPYAWEEFGVKFADLLALVSECGRTIEYLDPSLGMAQGASYGSAIIR